LSNAWRTRQFEYTWLRTLADRYADFWQVTEDALIFAAKSLKLDSDPQRRERLCKNALNQFAIGMAKTPPCGWATD